MRRIDILKMYLPHTRGRFFTLRFRDERGHFVTMNMKVSSIKRVKVDEIELKAYIPALSKHSNLTFRTDLRGDMTYLAADNSKLDLRGVQR